MSSTPEGTAPPGQALRAAREARNLPLHKAAAELRLAAEQITALEEGRYDSLGPAVFARGHLRRYAALLELPAEPLLEDYESAHRDEVSPTLVVPASLYTPVDARKSPPAVAMAVLVPAALAAIVAGAWWLQGRQAAVPVTAGAPGEVATAALEPGQAAGQPPTEIREAAPGRPDPDRLALDFTDSCWVEVYDATGQRLVFELAGQGTTLAFPGPAPWRVVLGNVRVARMSVGGRSVPLPGNVVVQNTASIYVDEAGTVARVRAASQDET